MRKPMTRFGVCLGNGVERFDYVTIQLGEDAFGQCMSK